MTVRRRRTRWVAVVVVAALIAGCGGGKDGGGGDEAEAPSSDEIVRGGTVRYGIEAETADGWCMQEAQLAISGILVARAIYDTLTAPNNEGEYVPYLAEAVEPNDDYTEWTITVREGVTFHDGSELTAEVVKNNLDAYRGAEGGHSRSPLLFLFVLDNIESVEVTGERDVTVTTKVPWVGFPAFLYSSGRLGITAQAQLDNTESCQTDLIGTGPFMLESPSDWVEGREFRAVKNPDYWQEAPDGEPYPYLDELIFEPILESEQRLNALESDDIQMAHFSASDDIIALRDLTEAGTLRGYESTVNGEVTFIQMNQSRPPFDDVRIRRAIALTIDFGAYNDTIGRGILEPANGVFAPGSAGYVEDTGYPTEANLDEARSLIAEYEAEKGPVRTLGYLTGPQPLTQEQAIYIQQTLEEVGLTLEIETGQQSAVIDRAISGDYDMQAFRNYPGGDPDSLYVWFKSASPVNFARINDPEIDRLLDAGRSEPDLEAREQIYQDLNRRMAEQVHYAFLNLTTWFVASNPDVYGYDPETTPPLPGDGGTFDEGLAVGHPLHGLWIDQ
ncbi:ABC transporter substrate-binding protein [Iamia sp. SCSIO 61187]|uniref:ABC transporter substrate-binding protein n=1 Tax=Iamia sp. SCSIO 61187 TaxID=2722752 RepID=UPI001C6305DB|nr:ABC transporter substrate-binding protein [Iamia sp. SCSIO 61187]QYG91142.1 ABC transporter substrate-binding protein [Iamia sp. SCSIO 61187]